MTEQIGWAVHTRLDKSSIFQEREIVIEERTFSALEDAEQFYNGPIGDWSGAQSRRGAGWLKPIPIVSVTGSGDPEFNGPKLLTKISFPEVDPPFDAELAWDDNFEAQWVHSGADQTLAVMNELEARGIIPGSQDPWGPPILTTSHLKAVVQEVEVDHLPDVECYLGPSWDFRRIATDARRRLGHVNANRSKTPRNQMLDVAADLEAALLKRHPQCTNRDVYHFWTSLQVYKYLAAFCQKKLWDGRLNELRVEYDRLDFCRVLGSYAHEIITGPTCASHAPNTEANVRALDARSSGVAGLIVVPQDTADLEMITQGKLVR